MVLALTLLIGVPATGYAAAELVRVTLRRMLSDAADTETTHSQSATQTR